MLESVHSWEPHIAELREKVRHALIQAAIPLRAYAAEYEQYLDLHNLDIDTLLRLVCFWWKTLWNEFEVETNQCPSSKLSKYKSLILMKYQKEVIIGMVGHNMLHKHIHAFSMLLPALTQTQNRHPKKRRKRWSNISGR